MLLSKNWMQMTTFYNKNLGQKHYGSELHHLVFKYSEASWSLIGQPTENIGPERMEIVGFAARISH